jgi:hypothetical protein
VEAIQLNGMARLHSYAYGGLCVNPDPPQVGKVTTLAVALKNSGPEAITVNRVQFMVAQFGMGLTWEKLPPVEQIALPANPRHIEEIEVQWTPTRGGHRCVHVIIEADILPQPLRTGRNLHVIESTAERSTWQVPFRLGNPEDERRPVVLELGGNNAAEVDAMILVNGRLLRAGQPVWLDAKQEVEARLLLHAPAHNAIEAIKTIEAYIDGRFIDGIQVEVYRSAYSARPGLMQPEPGSMTYEREAAAVVGR